MAIGTPLQYHALRRLSVLAETDPRTIARAIAGKPVQPLVLLRILRALEANGEGHLLPPPEQRKTAGRGRGGRKL